jgi:hypothetical protein
MKIVTKVIANKLKPLLPEIADEEKSAFVQEDLSLTMLGMLPLAKEKNKR